MNLKRSTLKHIMLKLSKGKAQKLNILNTSREKGLSTYKEPLIRLSADFSLEISEDRMKLF